MAEMGCRAEHTSNSERIIPVKAQPSEGWGKTKRGVSKRFHYFSAERALCSGSAPAGDSLSRDSASVDGEMCPDCVAKLQARTNRATGSNRAARRGGPL